MSLEILRSSQNVIRYGLTRWGLVRYGKKKKQLDDRSELKGQLLREPFDDEKMLEKQKSSPTLV